MRSRVGRTEGYEGRLEEGRRSVLARLCLEEMKERASKGKDVSRWKRERGQFFRNRGVEVRNWERLKVVRG